MPRKAAKTTDQRIASLHKAHRTEADIAAVLTREGTRITASGVHRILARLGLARARPGGAKPSATPATIPVALPAEGAQGVEDDMPRRLRRVIGSLEAAAEAAAKDRDIARLVSAQKAITGCAALLAKVTPAPTPTLDEHPDMVAAAKRGRERMHALLDRMLQEAG